MNFYSKIIATRGSPLAQWQANWAQSLLGERLGCSIVINKIKTTGDAMQSGASHPLVPFPQVPHWATGKGVFVKEIQEALLSGQAHIAVHSLKDVPVTQTPGLQVICLLPRAHPSDVLVLSSKVMECINHLNSHRDILQTLHKALLKSGFSIGTTSTRRQALSSHFFPGVPCKELRGNVDSRLKKVANQDYGAILLAKAGLDRLGLFNEENMFVLDPSQWVPASCQGIVVLEVSKGVDKDFFDSVAALTHGPSAIEALLERWVLEHMGGDCHTPIGIYGGGGEVVHCIYQSQRGFSRWSWDIPLGLKDTLLQHTHLGWEALRDIWAHTQWAEELKCRVLEFKAEVACKLWP